MVEAGASWVSTSASSGTPSAASAAHRSALASIASTGRAGAGQLRGVAPARSPAATSALARRRRRRTPVRSRTDATSDSRARRCAWPPAPAWRSASGATGRDRRRSGWSAAAPPACRRTAPPRPAAMKLKVTHSARPCAASVRRASAVRTCRGVSVAAAPAPRAAARPAAPHRGRAGAAPPRPGRTPASIVGAAFGGLGGDRRDRASRRLVQRDPAPRRRCARTAPRRSRWVASRALHREAEAFQRGDRLVRRNVGAAEAGDAGRSAAWRALPGRRRAPASVTAPGSPPHSSRIIAVAASTASGISAGSMPRSKRWRASETIWWRRPVSATRTGSNSAHSMNTEVVVSSQPVASPPITPAIDCTPAASAMAQSSAVTV